MGCRIIVDKETDRAAFYDSVTDWAFGPVFFSEEEAKAFIAFLSPTDPRTLRDAEMTEKHREFVRTVWSEEVV